MTRHEFSPHEPSASVIEALHIDVTKIVKCLSFTGFLITTVVVACHSTVKLVEILANKNK